MPMNSDRTAGIYGRPMMGEPSTASARRRSRALVRPDEAGVALAAGQTPGGFPLAGDLSRIQDFGSGAADGAGGSPGGDGGGAVDGGGGGYGGEGGGSGPW